MFSSKTVPSEINKTLKKNFKQS